MMDVTGMKQNKPFIIGVTGGVGAGKSTVLEYLKERYDAYLIMADDVAKELLMPSGKAFLAIKNLYPDSLFTEEGEIKRQEMAAFLFQHEEIRNKQNEIVFPLVKERIIELIKEHKEHDIIVVEAALLIEEHYDAICDVMWYIYSSEDSRRQRLKSSRGYSDERISLMMKSQLSHEKFMAACDVMINNDGADSHTKEQIDQQLYNTREK